MKITLGLLVAVVQTVVVSTQSVAQQCLTEQIAAGQNALPRQRGPVTAEDATLTAFVSICRDNEDYIQCFAQRLPTSTDPTDQFLSMVFDPRSMRVAYRGLCQDLPALRPRMRCLLSTPPVRACYDVFNQGVNQVINAQRQNQLQRWELERLACNISVARYVCETNLYRQCDPLAGEVMQSFFFAGIPQSCRDATGVASRYITLFGDLLNAGDTAKSGFIVSFIIPIISLLTLFAKI